MKLQLVRAVFRISSVVVATGGYYAIWFFGSRFAAEKLPWRRIMIAKWSKAVASTLHMKIETHGSLVFRSPFILVSNHLGYLDIPAFSVILPSIFVAKSDVSDWFLIGKIVENVGTVFIDRKNKRDILKAGEQMLKTIAEGDNLIFFPEGTSSNGEKLLPFNSSLFEFAANAALPVSYAAISYRIPGSDQKPGDLICWWGDSDFIPHLWQLCHVREFTAIITFGKEPIQESNRKDLSKKLHAAISRIFVPVK